MPLSRAALSAFDSSWLTAVFPSGNLWTEKRASRVARACDSCDTTMNSWVVTWSNVTLRHVTSRDSYVRAVRSYASSVTERISCANIHSTTTAHSSRGLSSYLPTSRARGLNFTVFNVFRCYDNVSFLSSVFPEIVLRDTSFVDSSFSSPVPLSSRKKMWFNVTFYFISYKDSLISNPLFPSHALPSL